MKTVFKLLCLGGLAIGGLLLLLWNSKQVHQNNNFTRLLPPHIALLQQVVPLHDARYYISGLTSTRVYLGNSNNPTALIVYTDTGDSLQTIHFSPSANRKFTVGAQLVVDSPNVAMIDPLWSSAFAGLLTKPILSYHPLIDYSFSRYLSLTASSYILLVFDTLRGQNKIIKKQFDATPLIAPSPILSKQYDGFFCTQGTFAYDHYSHQLFYTYQYRNEIIVLDTNLNVRYRTHTIDTISRVHLQIDTLLTGSIGKVTFTSPPLVVNQSTHADEGYLYVHSRLQADNENSELFDRSSAIDVYRQQDGAYQFSFYLADIENRKVTDFRILHKRLIVLNGPHLSIYTLTF